MPLLSTFLTALLMKNGRSVWQAIILWANCGIQRPFHTKENAKAHASNLLTEKSKVTHKQLQLAADLMDAINTFSCWSRHLVILMVCFCNFSWHTTQHLLWWTKCCTATQPQTNSSAKLKAKKTNAEENIEGILSIFEGIRFYITQSWLVGR